MPLPQASTMLRLPVPALNVPPLAKLPPSAIWPAPTTTLPPGSMVRSCRPVSAPDVVAWPATIRSEQPKLIAASAKLNVEPAPMLICADAGKASTQASAADKRKRVRMASPSVRPDQHLDIAAVGIEIFQRLADHRASAFEIA